MSANEQSKPGSSIEAVRSAKERAHATFGKLGKVVGVGITRVGNGFALKVNLQTPPRSGTLLPAEIDGVPVIVEVVGVIRKRAA
jgi:hypothetical protein